jgi:hypothetical protein
VTLGFERVVNNVADINVVADCQNLHFVRHSNTSRQKINKATAMLLNVQEGHTDRFNDLALAATCTLGELREPILWWEPGEPLQKPNALSPIGNRQSAIGNRRVAKSVTKQALIISTASGRNDRLSYLS